MIKRVAITGASGFVGSQLAIEFEKKGWEIVRFGRDTTAAVPFHLGEVVPSEAFSTRKIDALIHCAYDFSARGRREIEQRNVEGSKLLLRAAGEGGVERMVVLSSISAFAGCRSLYGRAKLEIEAEGLNLGALVVRPGLIYADGVQMETGMFASLSKSVKAKVVPIIDGGLRIQYLVHIEDLAVLLHRFLEGEIQAPTKAVTIASGQAWSMRELLMVMARRNGRAPMFISVPWWGVWAGLACAEQVGLKLGYRSDSVISLVYQNPDPDFASVGSLGVQVRDFEVRPIS